MLDIDEFSQLDKSQQITLITDQTPHISSWISGNIEDLEPQNIFYLYQISHFEAQSKIHYTQLHQNLETIINSLPKNINNYFDGLPLDNSQKQAINQLYQDDLVKNIQNIHDNLQHVPKSRNLEQDQDVMYYGNLLSDSSLDILDSVLTFNKKIDELFPELSNTIIDCISVALTAIITCYCPPIGLILKATGAIDSMANFFKTENLERTVNDIKAKNLEIQEDSSLSVMQNKGMLVSDIAEEASVTTSSVLKLGLAYQVLDSVLDMISHNVIAKTLLKNLCVYAMEFIPSNERDIDNTLSEIRADSIKSVNNNSKNKIEESFETRLDKALLSTKSTIYQTLKKDNTKFFDKIIAIHSSTKILRNLFRSTAIGQELIENANHIMFGNIAQVTIHKSDQLRHNIARHQMKPKSQVEKLETRDHNKLLNKVAGSKRIHNIVLNRVGNSKSSRGMVR